MISIKHLLLEAIIVEFIFGRIIWLEFSCVLSWFTDAGPISGEPFKGNFKHAGHTPGQSLWNQVVNVDRHPGWSVWILDHKRFPILISQVANNGLCYQVILPRIQCDSRISMHASGRPWPWTGFYSTMPEAPTSPWSWSIFLVSVSIWVCDICSDSL